MKSFRIHHSLTLNKENHIIFCRLLKDSILTMEVVKWDEENPAIG